MCRHTGTEKGLATLILTPRACYREILVLKSYNLYFSFNIDDNRIFSLSGTKLKIDFNIFVNIRNSRLTKYPVFGRLEEKWEESKNVESLCCFLLQH